MDAATPKPTIQAVIKLLGELRYSVSEFQESIDAYLSGVDEWETTKSWLASFEARLASLEVRLSMIQPESAWEADDLDFMLNELRELGSDIADMRQKFAKAIEEMPYRVM